MRWVTRQEIPLHAAMTAKRRRKLQTLAAEVPVPKVHGDPEGEALLVGWVRPSVRFMKLLIGPGKEVKASPRFICAICTLCQME
jgi:hypothetical protein